jgi:hypothetical protein
MGDVWTSITNVSIHLAKNSDVLIAVEERILILAMHARPARASMRGLVSLEAGIGQHHNKTLRVLIGGWDRSVLFSYQLWQGGRG